MTFLCIFKKEKCTLNAPGMSIDPVLNLRRRKVVGESQDPTSRNGFGLSEATWRRIGNIRCRYGVFDVYWHCWK